MNMLLQLAIAGALIAVFMLVRLLTEKTLMRQRLQSGEGCRKSGCFGACHEQDDVNRNTSDQQTIEPTNRSAHHAPR